MVWGDIVESAAGGCEDSARAVLACPSAWTVADAHTNSHDDDPVKDVRSNDALRE